MKNRFAELEMTLLDQIEKLNQDDICATAEEAELIIKRSEAMSKLSDSVVSVNRLKLDIVKELNNNGGLYEGYLGIEDK